MKNPRQLKKWGAWYNYVLDGIDQSSDVTNSNITFEDDKSRIKFFLDTFNESHNYDYNKKCCPSLRMRISDYIQGLPGCISVHYEYADIIRLSKEFDGYKSNAKESYYCNNWFKILADCILQLAKRYGINVFQYQ